MSNSQAETVENVLSPKGRYYGEVRTYRGRVNDYRFITQDPAASRLFRYKTLVYKNKIQRTLKRFFDFSADLGIKDPTSLVAWAKAREDIVEVQDLIEKFGETRPATCQQGEVSVIRALLKSRGIAMPASNTPQVVKAYHRGYKREELLELRGHLREPIQKLYVNICKDSGLRSQDVLALTYGHLKPDLDTGEKFVFVRFEPGFYNRRKASGWTFIGPDSTRILKQLVDAGEISTDPKARIFPMTYQAIGESLRKARDKARLDPIIQPSHGLRKFFENCLDKAGIDTDKKRLIEGHGQGVRKFYTDRDVTELRELYAKAYEFLDLSEQGAVEGKYGELQKQIRELEEKNRQLEEGKRREIEGLRGDLTNLQTQIHNLIYNPQTWPPALKATLAKLAKDQEEKTN